MNKNEHKQSEQSERSEDVRVQARSVYRDEFMKKLSERNKVSERTDE